MTIRKLTKGWALVLALILTLTFAGPSYATGNGGGDNHTAVTVCHWDNGHGGRWKALDTDDDSVVGKDGHSSHAKDIIPAFDYSKNHHSARFLGKNLEMIAGYEATGAQILANDCKVPSTPKAKLVPQGPVVVDECGTDNDELTLPQTSGVSYTTKDGYLYAAIAASNAEWGPTPTGWSSASQGKLKMKLPRLSDEPCAVDPGPQPDPQIDMTTVNGTDIQCDATTVATRTTTTTTPYKLSEDGSEWVLDEANATEVVTEGTRELTQDERTECPPPKPQKVTQWVLWTIPEPGCKDESALNMGYDQAGTSKGWQACNTASKAFPQTAPQLLTVDELKAFVPACGAWYQADLYKGFQKDLDAVLDNGTLTITNGTVEDSAIVQKWFFLHGADCVVTPVDPGVVDQCGAQNDSYTLPATEGIAYQVVEHDGHSYIKATITAAHTGWSLPAGWVTLSDTVAEHELTPFTNEPCIEVACWLMPVTSAPHGGAVPAWFPQTRVDCDDVIACGQWVQQDWYDVSTAQKVATYESLGDTLEWVGGARSGHPEDAAIYMRHQFNAGAKCAPPVLSGQVTAMCLDNAPVLHYSIALSDPDSQATPASDATITMSKGANSKDLTVDVSGGFPVEGNIPWPGAESGGWPGWVQTGGVWHEDLAQNYGWTRDGAMDIHVSYNPSFDTTVTYPSGENPCEPPVQCPNIDGQDLAGLVASKAILDPSDGCFVLVAWKMGSWVDDTTAVWDPTQVYVSNADQFAPDLNALDDSLADGCYQLDLYYDTQTTADLIAGGHLDAPGVPTEDLIPGGWGQAYKLLKVGTGCEPPVDVCKWDEETSSASMVSIAAGDVTDDDVLWADGSECTPVTYDVCSWDEVGQAWTMAVTYDYQLTEDSRFWDSEAGDNGGCADPVTPTLTGTVLSPVCDGDVPWLYYDVVLNDPDNQSTNTTGMATITFHSPYSTTADEDGVIWPDKVVDVPISDGRMLWPGASVADDGVTPTGWPGWAEDPELGWIAIGNENFGWTRQEGGIEVTIKVNPEMTATVSYPPATPSCATAPPEEITTVLGAPPLEPTTPLEPATAATPVIAEATFAG